VQPSAGASTGGVAGEREAADSYAKYLIGVVREKWDLPATFVPDRRRPFVVEIRVSILDDGPMTNARVMKGSGSADFDAAGLRAVRAASPVKPPPEAARRAFARGVVLEFDGGALGP
jgi:TonB family protein